MTVLSLGSVLCALLVLFPSGGVISAINRRIWEMFQSVFGWASPYAENVTPVHLEGFWNIVMFIPLGLGLALLLPRWWWVAVLHFASIAIESTQFFFLSARSADPVDVVANSTGGIIGVAIGVAVDALRRRRTEAFAP